MSFKDKDVGRPLSDHRSMRLQFHPHEAETVCTVSVAWRDERGPRHSVLARWHLGVSRLDLSGLATDDVLRRLIDSVVCRLESEPDPADFIAAVGTGAPVGATGATVTNVPLPGM